jgi:hypothetical protein
VAEEVKVNAVSKRGQEVCRSLARVASVVAVFAIVIGFSTRGASAAAPAPFLGTWWAVDPSDGSTQDATFGAGGTLFYTDDSAHICGGARALAHGAGVVSGDMWSGNMTLTCPSTGQLVPNLHVTFTSSVGGLSWTIDSSAWTRVRL